MKHFESLGVSLSYSVLQFSKVTIRGLKQLTTAQKLGKTEMKKCELLLLL